MKTLPVTGIDFGNAGVKTETVGKNKHFPRNIQIPWTYKFKTEPDLISLIDDITNEFTNLESNSMGGNHHARIIAHNLGIMLDIMIRPDKIFVYPVTNNHEQASEIMYTILQNYSGELL